MKRILATILYLVYLVATSGIGMNLRYCCDKLINVELSFTGETTLGDDFCGMQSIYKGKNCCKDINEQLKITQAQTTTQDINFPLANLFAVLQPCLIETPIPYFSSVPKRILFTHAPPFRETCPIYLKNCNFLI